MHAKTSIFDLLSSGRAWRFGIGVLTVALSFCGLSPAQLNQNCVVSVLNRTVQVNTDGTWVLPNIPANFGPVRARATCVTNGVTTFGQSDFFTIPTNGSTNVPPITLGSTTPIPTSIAVTSPAATLTSAGATAQLKVSALYAANPTKDVTAASAGTLYNISNPAIATVSANGLVTAVSSGTAVIQAVNEGRQGIVTIAILLAGAEHGGIPDSWAIAHGLDPTDPALPFEDPDHDGLTNLQEFQAGTDPNNPDTDGDGLTDGQEVLTYKTNPTLFSTDGTGISDGIEVQTGTLGAPLSAKLAKAIQSLSVTPSHFTLDVNSIQGIATQQLKVTALLIDGTTKLDLTSTLEGTTYSSSDLTVCNFGTPDGNIFAGNSGSCTITISNNGFSVQVMAVVSSFTPTALSFVTIPGFANEVAVNGNYAYVAAGSAGLQVVNVADRTNPNIIGSIALAGNANDVKLIGTRAYIASGSAGLQVVDVSVPASPVLLGAFSAATNALTVTVRGTLAYIVNGSTLIVADVTNPASISQIGSIALTGTLYGSYVDTTRKLAIVAAGYNGIYTVDISNPAAPVMLGNVSTGDARAVVIKGNYAFVADYVNSTTAVDITNPAAPVVVSHITDETLGGYLQDIVLSGNFTLAADVRFVNGIPITDVTNPTALIAREILNFPQRDDNGMGIAVDGSYAYLATEHNNLTKFGASGDSRLYIGQYLALVDNKGVPPTASITFPASGATVVEGAVLPITVAASDDIAVAAVNFVVNGNIVFTATAPPYQYNYTVPIGAKTVALGANAVDLGGNVGTAAAVTLNVIPDPGTTAQGQVRDQKAVPVPGATVTCLGVTGVSASDGTFSLPKVPTASGAISCIATIVSAGQTLSGSSVAVVPVLAGVTNVGNIVVTNGAPIAFVAGSSFADLGGVFDSIVVPTLPPVESFTPAGAGFVFTGKYMKIGVNSQGTFNYGGVGLQFDPTGSGSAFKPDVITPGTPRDVFGVRFDSGGSSFFAYGGSNNYPNDGNVALVSFATYSDSTIFAARSVTQYGPLQVISVTTLRQNDRYVSVDVTLVNTGGNSIDNLLFSRSADFDVEVPLNGYTNIFNQNKSPLGGTIIGACALYVPECYGLGTAAPFSVADGLTFADADPDVFRNQNPNGAEGDYSASLVFQVNTIAPGTSVHLTSKR